MRKPLLLAGIAFLFFTPHLLIAQPLNWGSSFSPPWTNGALNGNAHNMGGAGINGAISISITGGHFTNTGGNSPASPNVTGTDYTGPSGANIIELTPDFGNNQQSASMTINFSTAISTVNFYIVDIDKKKPNDNKYLDRVTVTGSLNGSTIIPTITKYDGITSPDFLIISGNSAWVNPANGKGDDAESDLTDQRGTVLVNFGANIMNSVTIKYDNAPGANNNPGKQSIGIGNIFFAPIPVPIRLSGFSGRRSGNEAELAWQTQLETNTANFIIERNTDGNWITAGTVPAQGNSTTTISYNFRDLPGTAPVILYRLKQVDIDGKFEYSNVIRLADKQNGHKILSYPNPFTREINISVYSATEQQVQTTLVDLVGKTIRSDSRELYAGHNNFTLVGLEALSHGIYYVIVKDSLGTLLGQTRVLKD